MDCKGAPRIAQGPPGDRSLRGPQAQAQALKRAQAEAIKWGSLKRAQAQARKGPRGGGVSEGLKCLPRQTGDFPVGLGTSPSRFTEYTAQTVFTADAVYPVYTGSTLCTVYAAYTVYTVYTAYAVHAVFAAYAVHTVYAAYAVHTVYAAYAVRTEHIQHTQCIH